MSKSKRHKEEFWLSEPNAKYKSFRICWYNERTGQTDGSSTHTTDPEDAQRQLDEWRLKHSKVARKDEPVLDSCNRYFLDYACKTPSAETVKRAMKRTLDVLGSPLCSEMTSAKQLEMIDAWRIGDAKKEEKAVSDATIDRWLGVLWAAMKFAADRGKLDEATIPKRISRKQWAPNFGSRETVLQVPELARLFDAAARVQLDAPTVHLWPPRKRYTSYRLYYLDPLTNKKVEASTDTDKPEEAERLRDIKQRELNDKQTRGRTVEYGHAWRFLVMMIGTAARSEAVLGLRKETQVDFEHHVLNLNPPGRKQTKKYRPIVAMAPTLEKWLQQWEPASKTGEVIGANGRRLRRAREMFRNLARKAGVKATPYTLRHTVATWLATRGVNSWERDMFMGHRRPDGNAMGNRYAHYEPKYLRGASNAIEALYEAIAAEMKVGDLLDRGYVEDQPLPPDDRQTGWLYAWLNECGDRLVPSGYAPSPMPERAPALSVIEGDRNSGGDHRNSGDLVGAIGIEPTTPCLSSRCSTTELRAYETDPNLATSSGPSATNSESSWQQRGAEQVDSESNQSLSGETPLHVKGKSPSR